MSTEVMGQQDGHIRIKGDCHVPLKQDQNFAATVLATNIMNQITRKLVAHIKLKKKKLIQFNQDTE